MLPEGLEHAGAAQHHAAGGIRPTRAQMPAQLEAVVGEVPDLEDGGRQEKGDDENCRPREGEIRVQFYVRGRARAGPGLGGVS